VASVTVQAAETGWGPITAPRPLACSPSSNRLVFLWQTGRAGTPFHVAGSLALCTARCFPSRGIGCPRDGRLCPRLRIARPLDGSESGRHGISRAPSGRALPSCEIGRPRDGHSLPCQKIAPPSGRRAFPRLRIARPARDLAFLRRGIPRPPRYLSFSHDRATAAPRSRRVLRRLPRVYGRYVRLRAMTHRVHPPFACVGVSWTTD